MEVQVIKPVGKNPSTWDYPDKLNREDIITVTV